MTNNNTRSIEAPVAEAIAFVAADPTLAPALRDVVVEALQDVEALDATAPVRVHLSGGDLHVALRRVGGQMVAAADWYVSTPRARKVNLRQAGLANWAAFSAFSFISTEARAVRVAANAAVQS